MKAERRVAALEYLAAYEDALLEFAKDMIRTPSPNPPGDERAVADLVTGHLRSLGVTNIERVGAEEHRPNVIVRVPGDGNGPSLMLSGHLDTKPPGDMEAWQTDPWDPVEADGQLWGLGSGDMKAAVAAMSYAAGAVLAAGPLRGDLVLAFTADEEAGSVCGAKWLAENEYLDADVCVIGEPSGITREWESIHLVSRGAAIFKINVRGTQMHSSITDRLPSVSAVVKMAQLIVRMHREFRDRITFDEHPLCPAGPTVNVGLMAEGGVSFGVNPGLAHFACDVRTLPGTTEASIRADIEAFLADARRDDPDLRAELDFHHMIDACEIDPAAPIVAALQSAAAQVLDEPPALDAFPGATDAPHFQLAAGIPTVAAFGPGMLSRAHSPNEHLAVASVAQAARIYTLAALDYLG